MPFTRPKHPLSGENGRLSAPQPTKIPSHWRKTDAQQALTRPEHPPTGRNRRRSATQTTKSSSDRRKTTAQEHPTRPKHPMTGEKHPPSSQLHDQNIQPLEESECWNTAKRTSSSSQWRKTPTQRPSMRPNHPVTGRNGRQAPPSEPNHPVTGEKHPPRRTR